MLRRAKFRVDFKVLDSNFKTVKMSEELNLPYRTEEINMHCSSIVYQAAKRELKVILKTCVDIQHIYELTYYEDIKN